MKKGAHRLVKKHFGEKMESTGVYRKPDVNDAEASDGTY